MTQLQGECVEFLECAATKDYGDFVTQEFAVEISNRYSACSQHGRKLLCCEKSVEIPLKIKPTEAPETISTLPESSPTFATMSPTPKPSTINPVWHTNYKFFKDQNCGSSSADRVANGKTECYALIVQFFQFK